MTTALESEDGVVTEPPVVTGAALEAALVRAYDECSRVTLERWNGTGDWRVSIPVRKNYDSDAIIGGAIRSAQRELAALRSALAAAEQEREALRNELNELWEHHSNGNAYLRDRCYGCGHRLRSWSSGCYGCGVTFDDLCEAAIAPTPHPERET